MIRESGSVTNSLNTNPYKLFVEVRTVALYEVNVLRPCSLGAGVTTPACILDDRSLIIRQID